MYNIILENFKEKNTKQVLINTRNKMNEDFNN